MLQFPTSAFKALAALGLLGLTPAITQAQTAYGLAQTGLTTAPNLVTFDVATPGIFTATAPITGLGTGQVLVGLDSRPNTGQLFALGYNPTGTQAQLYTLAATGSLTPVGTALTLNLGTNTTRVGFDFNPTVDRIRVTSGSGADFRLNPNNGALAATDGTLAYATTDANAGQTPGVGASAYTNSYIGSTATTLYNIDETASRLVTQTPPNNGTLNTVGPLGVTVSGATQSTDLDIYFNGTANTAYLTVASVTGLTTATSTLYTVNLTTGAATSVGALGSGALVAISDIALAITRPTLGNVTGQLVYALAGTNLITFDSALPGTIRTSVGITGVDAAQTLVGMDIRPATGGLMALGYNATAQTYQLYNLNATTGAATAVNATPTAIALGTGDVSFDFNPTVDRIRVVGANRANFRLNPNDGAIAMTDGTITFATTDANAAATPSIGGVAYTNSVSGTTATATMLYNYDVALNILTLQNPPNDGTLNTVGTSGITVNATAPTVDMDIYSSAAGTNTAYLVANTGTSANTSLYTVNTTTGAATLVGAIGNGIAARDIAVTASTGLAMRDRTELAAGFSLYPNPVQNTARLSFQLPRTGRAELVVFDNLGRRVDSQPVGLLAAGSHTITWNKNGARPGLYFFQLFINGQRAATRQVLLAE